MVDAQHGRATRAAGRKRDPLIEPRVFNAAIRSMPGTAGVASRSRQSRVRQALASRPFTDAGRTVSSFSLPPLMFQTSRRRGIAARFVPICSTTPANGFTGTNIPIERWPLGESSTTAKATLLCMRFMNS